MNKKKILNCPACGTKNRVSFDRISESKCGKCREKLTNTKPISEHRSIWRFSVKKIKTYWEYFWDYWDNPIKVIVAIFFAILLFQSIVSVWGEQNSVSGFFEELVARSSYWLLPIGAIFGVLFAVKKSTEITKRNAVVWVAAVGTFFLIATLGSIVLENIPGVDRRIERLRSLSVP